MPRVIDEEEAVNADSFLDIVASIVSVMIIMVMMTGLKIKNTPVDAQPTVEITRVSGELARAVAGEKTIRDEIAQIAAAVK